MTWDSKTNTAMSINLHLKCTTMIIQKYLPYKTNLSKRK